LAGKKSVRAQAGKKVTRKKKGSIAGVARRGGENPSALSAKRKIKRRRRVWRNSSQHSWGGKTQNAKADHDPETCKKKAIDAEVLRREATATGNPDKAADSGKKEESVRGKRGEKVPWLQKGIDCPEKGGYENDSGRRHDRFPGKRNREEGPPKKNHVVVEGGGVTQ